MEYEQWLTLPKTRRSHTAGRARSSRVNLTTGEVSIQSTDPYKSYIGGMGIANKIMHDEVPAGTDPLAPESKIVFAVGPLTASGVPLAGRTTVSFLSTFTTDHLVVDAHCGGMLGAQIKQAATTASSSRALPTARLSEDRRRRGQDQGRELRVGHGDPRHHRSPEPPRGA